MAQDAPCAEQCRFPQSSKVEFWSYKLILVVVHKISKVHRLNKFKPLGFTYDRSILVRSFTVCVQIQEQPGFDSV